VRWRFVIIVHVNLHEELMRCHYCFSRASSLLWFRLILALAGVLVRYLLTARSRHYYDQTTQHHGILTQPTPNNQHPSAPASLQRSWPESTTSPSHTHAPSPSIPLTDNSYALHYSKPAPTFALVSSQPSSRPIFSPSAALPSVDEQRITRTRL
jgi:hypothetical protein